MLCKMVAKNLFFSIVMVLVFGFIFGNCMKTKDVYASDNQLIQKIDQLLAGQSQMQTDIQSIQNDLKEIKTKLDLQAQMLRKP